MKHLRPFRRQRLQMQFRAAIPVAAIVVFTGCTHSGSGSTAAAPSPAPAAMPHVPADTMPVATASAGNSLSTMPLEHNATVDDLVELTGKELKLTKLIVTNKVQPLQGLGNAPMHGRAVTLQLLGEGRVAGQGPVNRYSGDLHITDPGRCNWVGPLTGTRMAGSAKAMELEERFLSTLGAAAHLIRAGDGLRFETADKSGAVEFHLVQ